MLVAIAKWVQLSHTARAMDVAYAPKAEPLYIYRRSTRDGTNFSLAPLMKRKLQETFGSEVHPRGSVFVDHETKEEHELFYLDLATQVIQLLTGLAREKLEKKFKRVIFLDPETNREIRPKPRSQDSAPRGL